ncbi:hypothetical protein TCELL_0764 [Thermogladius calderae 1633]|uniref:Uncharacterized protein n=1 Tax=Thermogladius calderae (strain DSM 22663 / VKM B-2946 / 1633) TaxID=1184251 RepID=I3TEK0_THEC1|nr:hypothetical protein [Thermogladius calderae]AFK51188.1 hypothetical protein TCELL_0764 [Thermogladius calderae 1633]
MIARLTRRTIIIQEAYSHWDIQDVLNDINPILLTGNYQPVYFFEGSPIIGQGGFHVMIKLSKELTESDYKVIRRLLMMRGINVVEEDRI